MKYIDNISDPSIKEFINIKDTTARSNDYIICESEKVINKLIKSNLQILKILGTEDYFREHPFNFDPSTLLCCASKSVLEQIIGHRYHHGIIAIAKRPEYVHISELSEKILILNGLTSPENVGTIIRNCRAFGVDSVIIDGQTCTPYIRRAVRVSIGNIFDMKVSKTENLSRTISLLKEDGYQIVSTANEDGAVNINTYSFKSKTAIIIGSEGHGIEDGIKNLSDDIVRIPIDDDVAHLNAATSSGIVLYELSKNKIIN